MAERGQGWQGSKMQAYWLVVRVLLTPPAEAAAGQKWKIIYLQVLMLRKRVWPDSWVGDFLVVNANSQGVITLLLSLRAPQNVAVAISGVTIEIAALGGVYPECNRRASLAMTMVSDFLSETLLCTGRQIGHPKNIRNYSYYSKL